MTSISFDQIKKIDDEFVSYRQVAIIETEKGEHVEYKRFVKHMMNNKENIPNEVVEFLKTV